jgi:hypothetical protein
MNRIGSHIVLLLIVAISVFVMLASLIFFPDMSAFVAMPLLILVMYFYSKEHGAWRTLGKFFKELLFGW